MAGSLFQAGGQTEQARRCRSLKINHSSRRRFFVGPTKAGSILFDHWLSDYYAKGRQEQAAMAAV